MSVNQRYDYTEHIDNNNQQHFIHENIDRIMFTMHNTIDQLSIGQFVHVIAHVIELFITMTLGCKH